MPDASLTRIVSFSAGHHYRRADWDEARNRAAFGGSMTPHGHNYRLFVTVVGPVDPDTSFLVDLPALDHLLRTEVVERLDQQDLNEAIPEVREGRMLPSTEALARWFWERLSPSIPPPARLLRVRVEESATLMAEYPAS